MFRSPKLPSSNSIPDPHRSSLLIALPPRSRQPNSSPFKLAQKLQEKLLQKYQDQTKCSQSFLSHFSPCSSLKTSAVANQYLDNKFISLSTLRKKSDQTANLARLQVSKVARQKSRNQERQNKQSLYLTRLKNSITLKKQLQSLFDQSLRQSQNLQNMLKVKYEQNVFQRNRNVLIKKYHSQMVKATRINSPSPRIQAQFKQLKAGISPWKLTVKQKAQAQNNLSDYFDLRNLKALQAISTRRLHSKLASSIKRQSSFIKNSVKLPNQEKHSNETARFEQFQKLMRVKSAAMISDTDKLIDTITHRNPQLDRLNVSVVDLELSINQVQRKIIELRQQIGQRYFQKNSPQPTTQLQLQIILQKQLKKNEHKKAQFLKLNQFKCAVATSLARMESLFKMPKPSGKIADRFTKLFQRMVLLI